MLGILHIVSFNLHELASNDYNYLSGSFFKIEILKIFTSNEA